MADDSNYRVISREYPDGRRILAAIKNTNEPGQKTDDEILNYLEEHIAAEQHLNAIDDE